MMTSALHSEEMRSARLTDEQVAATAAWLHRARLAPPSSTRDDALAEWCSMPEATDPRIWTALARLEASTLVGSWGRTAPIPEPMSTQHRPFGGMRISDGVRAAAIALAVLLRGSSRWF